MILCRVVWDFDVIIDRFSPTNKFINVDFPAFGFPMMLTNPDLCVIYFNYNVFYKETNYIFVVQSKERFYSFWSESKKIQCGVEQLVARRAHNPKVTSSSLVPATKRKRAFTVSKGSFFYGILKTKKSQDRHKGVGRNRK